jgi:protein-S-isoprenylcysteine O-methyltransferase Ste14
MVPMKPSTALVTSSPYRVTRNPMYVGWPSSTRGWRSCWG